MRTIAVLNQKGGVGKTTTAVNTAAALAAAGSKVVVIDLDPQAHMTIHLGLEPQTIEAGSYKVLTQSAGFEEQVMLVRPNLWLLPANIDLVGAESELVSVVGRETILREALESSAETFDYCFIDCAPSLGLLTLNALAASEEVLIPLQPHFLALQGFGKLLQTVDLVNKRINPNLKVKGILLCMFDTRASLPSEVKADIEQFLESARGTDSAWSQARIIPTYIRRNIKLAEAPSYGKTIFEYEPDCNGARDYWNVARCVHAQFQPVAEVEIPEPVAADDTTDQSDCAEQVSSQPDSRSADETPGQADPVEPSPPRQQYVDIHEIHDEPHRPQIAPPQQEQQHFETEPYPSEPPIRIQPIDQPDSHSAEGPTQTTGEPDKPESRQTDYGFDRF
ncbi:MAG: ParA family protein [Planctomycetota bacterium]|jgi:chromosome partitioning protein